MIPSYLLTQTLDTIQQNIPQDLLEPDRTAPKFSHWSEHFTTLGALVMSITAVAAAILSIYPLAAACALSALTHLIAGHYIGEFCIYKATALASEQLRERNVELMQNVQQLQDALAKLKAINLSFLTRMTQHEAVDKDYRVRLEADLAELNQAADHLDVVNLVEKHLIETAQEMATETSRTADQFRLISATLKEKETLIQQLSDRITQLETSISTITNQRLITEQELAGLRKSLSDTSALLANNKEQTPAQFKAHLEQTLAANKMIESLMAKINSLKTENAALKTASAKNQVLKPSAAAAAAAK